ncbi:hypothetical protein SI65_02299 [Aspergillus cristatus]|uniref:SMODS and SLOG-associating 2TM effector domain-containing protein n=1 Tax=Aspergillus cristatus TaxID=573508 RepID=A0A1E3BKG3_ASPCR|nr:hypothetical protein SI65_02299 [Aspergillus cristatus]
MSEQRRGRSLFWRLLAALDPEEPGLPRFQPLSQQIPPTNNNHNYNPEQPTDPQAYPHTHPQPPIQPMRRTVTQTDRNHLIPPEDKLLVFRALTGIDTVPALTIPHHSDRHAPNVGIYERVVRAEQSADSRYRFFSVLINVCLGIQVVAAAAITALGAASGPHSAVTAFGALNTIMAGILTYLKGSGLPDRLKHYQNEWRNIREYIEQRERELCLVGSELDVQEEIQIVEHMYEGVKREIESTKSGESRTPTGEFSRRSFLPRQHYHEEQHPRPRSPESDYGASAEKYRA